MKRITWHVAKIYKGGVIDFWADFPSRREAEKFLKDDIKEAKLAGDNDPSPFHLVKTTHETVVPSFKRKKP